MSETPAAIDRAIAQFEAVLRRVAEWAAAEKIDLTETGYTEWATLLCRAPYFEGAVEDLAVKRARLAKLDAVLRRVEEWSLETVNDLTPAGYDQWAILLHGPRKRKSRQELLHMLEEIEAHDGAQRERGRVATRH